MAKIPLNQFHCNPSALDERRKNAAGERADIDGNNHDDDDDDIYIMTECLSVCL